MASKKRKRSFRGSGSGVREHAIQRLRQYIGNKRGYSDKIGRKILLACRRFAMRTGSSQVFITKEVVDAGGGRKHWLDQYKIRDGIFVIFNPDWSVANVFQLKE